MVYGIHITSMQNESDRRGGVIVNSLDEVPAALNRVAGHLGFEARLAEECIAKLPPEKL